MTEVTNNNIWIDKLENNYPNISRILKSITPKNILPSQLLPPDLLSRKSEILWICRKQLTEINPLTWDLAPWIVKSFTQSEIDKIYDIIHSKEINPNFIRSWFVNLSVEQVRSLNGTDLLRKKLRKVLYNLFYRDVISKESMVHIMNDFLSKVQKSQEKNQQELKSIYSQFEKDIQKIRASNVKFKNLTVHEFFTKLFIHESWWNKEKRSAKIFAASGTGALGLSQSTKWAFDTKENRFNPLDPNQAIPGSIQHFLLECYSKASGNGVVKLARALDIYNKWAKWTLKVPDGELLSAKTKRYYAQWNPGNYAYIVLTT